MELSGRNSLITEVHMSHRNVPLSVMGRSRLAGVIMMKQWQPLAPRAGSQGLGKVVQGVARSVIGRRLSAA